MSKKLISIACEGPHDVAFVNRILKAQGFSSNEKTKMGEYPFPMGDLFKKSAERSHLRELNFAEARQNALPTHSLLKDDVFIFLYSLGGDGKKKERASLIKELTSFISQDPSEVQVLPDDTSLSLVFLLDSDNQGVERRLAQISTEVCESLGLNPQSFSIKSNGDCCLVSGLRIGCFILTDSSNDTGKLEDILIPMMKQGNEGIFEAAERFINDHYDKDRLKFLKIRIIGDQLVENRESKKDYDHKKSLIGVVSQLQLSGKPNAACINRADYLNMSKLTGHPTSKQIQEFIQTIIS